LSKKWESFGWHVQEIDGHSFDQIFKAVDLAKKSEKPSMIIAYTIKGKGISFMENANKYHGRVLSEEQLKEALKELR
jgi:transketolase